jgi:hypothetical protein
VDSRQERMTERGLELQVLTLEPHVVVSARNEGVSEPGQFMQSSMLCDARLVSYGNFFLMPRGKSTS